MKHKKIFIIMAVIVIMATFTFSTSAQIPSESITGYYYMWEDYEGDNQYNNSHTINEIGYEDAYEYITFFYVDGDFYFYDSTIYNDGDTITYGVVGTGALTEITIDVIDATYSEPSNAIIYWNQSVETILQYDGVIYTTSELTYEPEVESNNIYADIYGMIHQYIFGGAELSANQDLIATLTATWSCILLVMLPFVIVWGIFKLFVR